MKAIIFFEFDAVFPGEKNSRTSNVKFLVNKIVECLRENSYEIVDQDLWKDCGWYITVMSNNQYGIYIAKYFDNEPWQLTLSLVNHYGFLARLFGKRNSGVTEEAKTITNLIFKIIKDTNLASNIEITHAYHTKISVNDPKNLKWD